MQIRKEDLEFVLTSSSGRISIAKALGITEMEARALVDIRDNLPIISSVLDSEAVKFTQKLASQKQKNQDINRIERKTFRQNIRLYNWIEAQNTELINLLKNHSLKIKTNSYPSAKNKPKGVVQISDTHFNELVNLEQNKYDFKIASKRIEKYIKRCITLFKTKGISDVVVCMTGDLINSDRRDDEKTNMATNRVSAQFLAVEILLNAILDLNKHFNISVSYVDGNESRLNKDLGWNEIVMSDTFDTSIYCILRRLLQGKKGIDFDNRLGGEKVVKVNSNFNLLLVHGHAGFQNDPHKAISNLITKYSHRGVSVNYVIFGHIHEALCSDRFSRSGSPVGDNAYSDKALNLCGKASQNCYIVYPDGSLDACVIDLQNYKKYKGYPIQKELEAYNVKSADKCRGVSIYDTVLDKLH